jgi:fimbrial isopeptide formation D2 family protein/LPXTG-motif cell wall-anchored protein
VNCTFTNAGPASVPTVTKSVSSTTQNGDGSWTIVYDVAVGSAPTAAMTQYTLTDTLAFGSGIAVNSAHVDGPADETLNPNWNGSTDTTVVTSGPLQTGETDHYTVTVNATVTSEAAAEDRACASGGGFANSAQVGLAPPVFTAALAAAQADPTAAQDASACADPASPMITKQVIGSAQHPGDATWDVTYSLSVKNPATTTGLVYSLTDTPGFPPGVPVNSATVTAAHDSTGTPITGLINTWDGNTLFIITAKDLAAGITDTYTLVINTTVTTQDGSTNQCQTGDSGHGYLNTGAVTSGQDTVTAQACTAIAQPVPPPDPTPAAPPSPAPLLPNTGVAVTDFLTTAFGLLITGTLLLLISRRRTRTGCRGPGRGGCSGSPGHSCC